MYDFTHNEVNLNKVTKNINLVYITNNCRNNSILTVCFSTYIIPHVKLPKPIYFLWTLW